MVNMVALLLAATLAASTNPHSKRGYVFSEDSCINISALGKDYPGLPSQVNWEFNQRQTTSRRVPGVEFVPTMYSGFVPRYYLSKGLGSTNTDLSKWAFNVEYWLQHGTKHLLSIWNPEMTPSEGVKMWKQHMDPYKGRAALGAPTVWKEHGEAWLASFLHLCKQQNCHIDFFTLLSFEYFDSVGEFQSYVGRICKVAAGKPVWVAPFDLTTSREEKGDYRDGDPEKAALVKRAAEWLDKNPCVQRYAFNGAVFTSPYLLRKYDDTRSFTAGPELTTLGFSYVYASPGHGSLS